MGLTIPGVSNGLQAGNSCCVNLESEGDNRKQNYVVIIRIKNITTEDHFSWPLRMCSS